MRTATSETIGARVRAEREARGVLQRDLARALGISASQLLKYEHGRERIKADMVAVIARHLRVPVSRFYRTDDNG